MLERLVEGADVVIHCAATMGRSDPARSLAVNAIGTERLARMARAAGVRRFVYVSSISVYAATIRPGNVITEADEPESPETLNAYGYTKWLGEQRLRDAARGDLAWTVIRPTNIFGPGSGPWFHQWERTLRRFPFAAGDVAIDMVYVDDVADAVALAALSEDRDNHVFHVGHEMVKLHRFVEMIGNTIGRRVHTLPGRLDAGLRYTIEHGYRLVTGRHMSLSLTRSVRYPHDRATVLLGYRPRVDLSEGFASLRAWYARQVLRPMDALSGAARAGPVRPGAVPES